MLLLVLVRVLLGVGVTGEGMGAHVLDPSADQVSPRQLEQNELPEAEYFPAGQFVQLVAPD